MAQHVELLPKLDDLGEVLAAASLNGATPDTGWIDVRRKRGLRIDCVVVNGGTATAVAATFVHKAERGSDEYVVPEIPSGGAMAELTQTWTLANGLKFSYVLNVSEYDYIKATFTGTGAGAGDTIAAYAVTVQD